MSALTYEPAAVALVADALLAVAADGACVVIDDRAGTLDIVALWAALQGRDAVADIMAVLTVSGLAATPPFALLVPVDDGGARLVVRGPLVAEVVDADGSASAIDASTVVTWAEHLLADAVSVTVRRRSDARAGGVTLPLWSGAVRASSVTVALVPVGDAHAESAALDSTVVVPHLQRPAVAASLDDVHSTRAPEHTIIPAVSAPASPDSAAPDSASPDFAAPAASGVESASSGDHDGLTVVARDLEAMRAAAPADAPAAAPRYVLDISSGGSAALDGSIIVGRAPSTSRVSDGRIPQLVGLPGADDVSRNHVRFDLEGDSVVVTDLHSRNGTVLRAPGATPRQLRAGESSVVLGGTVVDLGGVTLTVREG